MEGGVAEFVGEVDVGHVHVEEELGDLEMPANDSNSEWSVQTAIREVQ